MSNFALYVALCGMIGYYYYSLEKKIKTIDKKINMLIKMEKQKYRDDK